MVTQKSILLNNYLGINEGPFFGIPLRGSVCWVKDVRVARNGKIKDLVDYGEEQGWKHEAPVIILKHNMLRVAP